jgi:predicted nucleic acid-binding protein
VLTHVLDTSAWLAHTQNESGGDDITHLFEDPDTVVGVSVLSFLEVNAVFRAKGLEPEFHEILESYRQLFNRILPIDEAVVLRAITLRESAARRLPALDSLIAATAAHHNAILVHRDRHFSALPGDQVRQRYLDDSDSIQ